MLYDITLTRKKHLEINFFQFFNLNMTGDKSFKWNIAGFVFFSRIRTTVLCNAVIPVPYLVNSKSTGLEDKKARFTFETTEALKLKEHQSAD
jgi:hypothetical protein